MIAAELEDVFCELIEEAEDRGRFAEELILAWIKAHPAEILAFLREGAW